MFTLLPNTLILQNTICNQDYNNNNNPLSKRIKQKGKQKIASEEKFICIYVCSMMEMISLKNLENAERCLMRAEAHKAWKDGEIYFFEISFYVVGNWKKLYFEREYPVYCLERSMKLHPVARHRFSWKYLRNDAARLIPENRTSVCRVEFEVEKCPRKNAFEWKYSGIHRSIYWSVAFEKRRR